MPKLKKREKAANFWHRLIAKIRRKFWTYCPRCGKPFGGHQKYGQLQDFAGDGHYRIVCHRCKKVALTPPAP